MFPGQEKCSFHNSDGKKIANSSFSSKSSEMIGKTRSSSKKIYHPIFPQDTENLLLTHLAISFFLRIKPSARSPKRWTNLHMFLAKFFLLKVFTGHEKCKLDNYAELNSLNHDLFSAQSPKLWTKSYAFHQNIFSSKCLLDRRKAVLTSIREKVR